MGFALFIGRLLFASLFILSAYQLSTKHVVLAAIVLKGFGGIGFIFGSYSGAILLLLYQLVFTPVLYDFYNYDVEHTEFSQLFTKFTQNMALLGALLFFIGMKHSISLRQPRKILKTKTG